MKFAIAQEQIWPAFQPVVDIRSGKIASFEILARWRDSSVGEISPATFISHLERHGLIDLLSDALVSRACREAAAWPGQFSLAFNISPVQLAHDDFPQRLAKIVADTGFPLNRVELEVTEATLVANEEQAFKILREVNDLGVRIGIDDFGTGYSNLARLESFPFDKLKIDARFIRDLHENTAKRRIVGSVIGLGQSLGITVVAEGIETAAEESILRDFGCDLGQGWLYAKAQPGRQALLNLEERGCAARYSHPLDASPFQQLHQLATLYDKAPAGLCFLDMNYRHVRCSAQFASIHGMTPCELEGKSIYEILSGEVLHLAEAILTKTASTDAVQTMDYAFQGQEFRIICARVLDLAGEIIGFSIVSLDVTEENRLKATLLASERHLRQELDFAEAIVNSLPGIFYYYDADLRLRRWNRNYVTLTGYTNDQLRIKEPLQCFADDDKDLVAGMVQQILSEGQGQFEADFHGQDGSSTPYLFTGVKLDPDTGGGFVGVGIDISKHQQAERDLRERTTLLDAVLNSSDIGILVVNPQGETLIQNARLRDLFRMPEAVATSHNGKLQFDFISSRLAEPAKFAAEFTCVLACPDSVRYGIIKMADGAPLRRSAHPIRDQAGQYYGHIWSFGMVGNPACESA